MMWQPGDENDGRVIRRDGWLDLIDVEAPSERGVFVFVSEDVEVKYVGCAREVLSEEIKAAVSKGKASGASMYSWYVTDSESAAESLKTRWVEKYKPQNNL
jgi:excinuclease UvrABC nuclease subunit